MSCLAKRIASLSSHSELRSSIRSGPNSSASSAVENCSSLSFSVPLANITTISWPPLPFKYSNTRNLWCRALPYQVPSLDQPMIGSPTVVTESNSTRAMTSATSTTLSNVNRWGRWTGVPKNLPRRLRAFLRSTTGHSYRHNTDDDAKDPDKPVHLLAPQLKQPSCTDATVAKSNPMSLPVNYAPDKRHPVA